MKQKSPHRNSFRCGDFVILKIRVINVLMGFTEKRA